MILTDFHACFYAHELTKRCASGAAERLSGALVDAQVDLNPHQVEAALFAFRSPLVRGTLLADEVGLGKTIEAGLVISQKWAERRRHILVIAPANLRKQWHQELQEKFFLPGTILEAKTYSDAVKRGHSNPFRSTDAVMICSYQFAKTKEADLKAVPWDLVVLDEAHRLRNVYKPGNIIGNVLKKAVAHAPKLLLTATPLQNSLQELYGLVSFMDDRAFGDLKSFREQFGNLSDAAAFDALKARLRPFCHRTLRKQVLEYVPYTRRHALTLKFLPGESEDRLYGLVSEYLQRENLQALPTSQRSLMTMILRKLLASSSFAIAGALDTLLLRLKGTLGEKVKAVEEDLDEDYEALEQTAEEWPEEEDEDPAALSATDRQAIEQEIADLSGFRNLARSITENAKGTALLAGLAEAFRTAEQYGGARKAIVFTESRRTQEYLLDLLAKSPYKDGLLLFNGSNSDERSKAIYANWIKQHKGTDRATGSRTADMRSALVDYFRDHGSIMIATEAGAEGINLQFCSLVINYDLPWNPQRIEQRIGRCHRYGQKFDVVVVNFLNETNAADLRVFELLREKFALFDGVFGASDEVLGAIESGVDFEKRINDIYQKCRTQTEIVSAFDQLQADLAGQIADSITTTRRALLEHFDEDVHNKLRIRKGQYETSLNRYERMLMRLTRYKLGSLANFDPDDSAFVLTASPPSLAVETGRYELPRRQGEAHLYRLQHPLAQSLLNAARNASLPPALVTFDTQATLPRVAALDAYRGQRGELIVSRLSIESMDQGEDYLLVAAVTERGELLPDELASRFFQLSAVSVSPRPETPPNDLLSTEIQRQQTAIQTEIARRNSELLDEEVTKLDGWADDLKTGLQRDIKELDRQIKEAKKLALAALGLAEKLAGQQTVRTLEATRKTKRRELYAAEDEIDARKDEILKTVEGKLSQVVTQVTLFTIGWNLK